MGVGDNIKSLLAAAAIAAIAPRIQGSKKYQLPHHQKNVCLPSTILPQKCYCNKWDSEVPDSIFLVPILVLRLSSLGTRFQFRLRFRLRDCAYPKHDSVPRHNISRTRFRFRVLIYLKHASDTGSETRLKLRVSMFWFQFQKDFHFWKGFLR